MQIVTTSRQVRKTFPRYIEHFVSSFLAFNQTVAYATALRDVFHLKNVDTVTSDDVFYSIAMHSVESKTDPYYHFMPYFKAFTNEDLLNNPYYRDIKLKACVYADFKIDLETYKKGSLFQWDDDIWGISDGLEIRIPCIGYWKDEPLPNYTLKDKNNTPWMSITFNEIYSMEQPVSEAKGNVLTLGCGLGYYAYMVAIKPEVDCVTIVENNESVIELFKQQILPQFGQFKDKVSIIQADVFDYMPTVVQGTYDYCFADIWSGALDSKTYYSLRKLCGDNYKGMRMSYWIESSFVATLVLFVRAIIALEYLKLEKVKLREARSVIEQLLDSDKYTFAIANNILNDVVIRTMDDIDFYWKHENVESFFFKNASNLIP